MGTFRAEEQLIAAWKHRVNIAHTAFGNTNWYNELLPTGHQTFSGALWSDMAPGDQYYANYDGGVILDAAIRQERTWTGTDWNVSTVGHGNVIPVEKIIMPLTPMNGTNGQSHIAVAPPLGSIDPADITPAMRYIDWMNPFEFGVDFSWRIYWDNGSGTGPGSEITTVALANGWLFDPYNGNLLAGSNISGVFTPTGTLPIWIVAYRYIGEKGAGGGGPGYIEPVDVGVINSGTTIIDTFPDTEGEACVWHFWVKKGSDKRAGTVLAGWDATTDSVEFYENGTLDIGSTAGVTFEVSILSNNVRLSLTVPSNGWAFRAIRTMI